MADDSASLFAKSAPRKTWCEPQARGDQDDRWWIRKKPKPTRDEARSGLASYSSLLDRMDETARWEEAERRRIAAVADQAELDMLSQIAADYAAGKLSQFDLSDLYYCYREVARPGHGQRWNRVVPFSVDEIVGCRFSQPDADGCWSGTYPYRYGQGVPPDGQPVVYWLTDAEGVDCYIGSTEKFRKRLKCHRIDGKEFVAWRAVPYPTRQAAYDAEDALLRAAKPYLNQKASR